MALRLCLLEIPPTYHNGGVVVESLSVDGNLDGPKIQSSATRSSFDFWYFGAASSSNTAGVIVTFFNTAELGHDKPLSVQVSGSFPNGTLFSGEALATSNAVVNTCSGGIAGIWGETGASFRGTDLQKVNVEYDILLDMASIGTKGNVVLKSATVNLDINGTSLSFSNGIGYHDKNWGDAPVYTNARSWDWGHARFGPYSIVWFGILDRTNTERLHAFVAKDGKPVLLSCVDSVLQVHQWGGDAAYPPVSGLGHVGGLTARFTLQDGQVLVANVTTDLLIENLGGGIFTRAIGSVKGGVVGQDIFEGRAMYDENIFG
ncbi:hypothetical protein CDEST_15283 [Colletotrichum destructivum]|uniref:Hydroxyneurosporene synthase n=1 Tax=Colletotrichum destructivum TaxID=34406 RepID=A0AAX4J3V4_9PEZI|nr:hypothetical protein CDEST_15283 [Colletotrichum destructivum]